MGLQLEEIGYLSLIVADFTSCQWKNRTEKKNIRSRDRSQSDEPQGNGHKCRSVHAGVNDDSSPRVFAPRYPERLNEQNRQQSA